MSENQYMGTKMHTLQACGQVQQHLWDCDLTFFSQCDATWIKGEKGAGGDAIDLSA